MFILFKRKFHISIKALQTFFLTCACMLLCSVNLLLPIENGFPKFYIGPMPLVLPMIANAFVYLLFFISNPIDLLKTGFTKHTFALFFLLFSSLILSIIQGELLITLLITGNLFSIFIINYILISYIFKLGGREIFIKTLCFVALLATIPGLYEFFFGQKLLMYKLFDAFYWYSRGILDTTREGTYNLRVTGTLGNSIVYSTAMLLCLPFVFELKQKWKKISLGTLILFVSICTLSRTIIFLIVPLLLGYLIIKRTFDIRKLILFASILTIIIVIFGSSSLFESDLTNRWKSRSSEESAMGERSGIKSRMLLINKVWDLAISNPKSFLFGRGYFASKEIGSTLFKSLATIDNAYMTILYENGIIGLIFYLFFYIWTLYRTRIFARYSYHWYSIIALMLVGFSFVTYMFFTVNFIAVASLVTIINTYPEIPTTIDDDVITLNS